MEQPRPDDKDWTWVLDRACPECGFEAGAVARGDIGAGLRSVADGWHEVLGRGPAVPERPPTRADGSVVWSALEYGCHVRDVFVLFAERLDLMLTQDDPLFANWDQDATAVAERYWEQDPALVREDLRAAGHRLADAFDALGAEQWDRTGRRSDGANFTVTSFGRYLLHDPVHHLWDAERGLAALG